MVLLPGQVIGKCRAGMALQHSATDCNLKDHRFHDKTCSGLITINFVM
jgi:hypothetical protein